CEPRRRGRTPSRCVPRARAGSDDGAAGPACRRARAAPRASARRSLTSLLRGERQPADKEPVAVDAPLALEQRLPGRPGRDAPVLVEHAPVAWAEEEVRALPPLHGAAEMRAVLSEDLEREVAPLLAAAHPERRVRALACPRQRRGIVDAHERDRPEREVAEPADLDELARRALKERGEEVAEDRYAEHHRYGCGARDRDPLEEPAPPHRYSSDPRYVTSASRSATPSGTAGMNAPGLKCCGSSIQARSAAGSFRRTPAPTSERPARCVRSGPTVARAAVPRIVWQSTQTWPRNARSPRFRSGTPTTIGARRPRRSRRARAPRSASP